MRVLVACEFSGVVREAFRARGHEAYSCDILPAEDNSKHHFQEDVLDVLSWCGPSFDLMIAHPPCTYLCNSGVWALHRDEERWNDLKQAREFFLALWTADVPKICIENPIPHKYGQLPPYSQIIQPYQFGDDASKKTCLWLKGLPTLSIPGEDQWVQPRIVDGKKRWSNQTDGGQNKLGPSKTRAHERSRTYQGIAKAFAEQWG